MKKEAPLVDKDYLLQKFEGKGGWTFVEIPEIPKPRIAFGMFKVKGTIDDYEFSDLHLMPLGNGNLFLPVKAAVKKKIKKEAPETVHITLYEDKTPLMIPEELILCLKDEQGLYEKFMNYSEGQKRTFAKWINSAKTEETKIDRIAKTINMVQDGERFY